MALVAFRGEKASLLLTPTASLEQARYKLENLPTGGGTPLGAALLKALELSKSREKLGLSQAILVILSDGRANVPVKAEQNIERELNSLAIALQESKIKTIVVDTSRRFSWGGAAEQLARRLGGKYSHLPYTGNATVTASLIAKEVSAVTSR